MDSNFKQLRLDSSEESLKQAAALLKAGRLVVIPTETVYGLAADALNPEACAKIFAAKQRPGFDPLICHISGLEMLATLTTEVPAKTKKIIDRFWPGPLTVILPKTRVVPEIVTSGLSTVAVRMPAHPVARRIIELSGRPLAAPSANLFGRLSPTRAKHTHTLTDGVSAVVDAGPSEVGLESTIIREYDGRIHLLRPGGISKEEIEELLGESVVTDFNKEMPDAPGQLLSHYAPVSPVAIVGSEDEVVDEEECCYLAFFKKPRKTYKASRVLSPKGELTEAAAHLFEYLHELDAVSPRCIYAEAVTEEGIGQAIMNRLKKAAHPKE